MKRVTLKTRLYKKIIINFIPLLILFLISFFAEAIEFSPSYLADIGKNYGEYAMRRLKSWEKVTVENKNIDEDKKLEVVNNFFNLLNYRRDIDHWGEEDHWATPLEFVVSGAGDCEAFSTAKYFTLLDLGVSDDKLLMMYVKLKTSSGEYSQAHMVLLYYSTPTSVPLVLDNINKEILSADLRTDLKPIYGFNGTGLWQAKELGKGNKIGQPGDLKRWADLSERMKSGKISKWIDNNI